jgi:hypothetical protein
MHVGNIYSLYIRNVSRKNKWLIGKKIFSLVCISLLKHYRTLSLERKSMNRFKKIVLAAVVAAASMSTSAHASLIGDTITGTGTNLTPEHATIHSSAPEFAIQFIGTNNKGASYTYDGIVFDFEGSTLIISTPVNTGFTWGNLGTYTFSDFDNNITNVVYSASASHNFGSGAGDFTNDFSFGDHSITFNLTGGESQNSQSTLVFNITTKPSGGDSTSVPEPTTVALLGLGLLGLAALRGKLAKNKNA